MLKSTASGEGHRCLEKVSQGTVCKILNERRSSRIRCATTSNARPEFTEKMAKVLWVYREVKLLKEAAARIEDGARRCGSDHLFR